ncbi:MAG: radical SAM protein, partial [Nitrosopumilaceae archaeon]|nr:radical SAM protein [Nitrosopumilaceae archaeon]NIU86153.1 radical SAM protein [Nitrosopumilaceae archaeon]NIV64607.1 radical SAM protein [Nitrosopumilaceae archaeon]NIX60018.1 radical SAM protein [Nitrosopumilaceae archaeon]
RSFENDKVYRFLHIPVQSGSNKVLNDMKRGHTAETYQNVVKEIRDKFTKFTISTDIIVGFPTETDSDFEKTVKLLEDTKPDIINLSRYSQRPGTDAAELEQLEAKEIKRRSKIIADMADRYSLENNRGWIGWKGPVLFDEKIETGSIKGRNFAYKPIFVRDDDNVRIGDQKSVEIID